MAASDTDTEERVVTVTKRGKCDVRVLGAGFSRSGSFSLAKALEQLGVGKVWHPMEMFEDRSLMPAMNWWRGKSKLIKEDPDAVDYDDFFHILGPDYHSAIDWPTYFFWDELSQYYPLSKVIVSVRDKEQWHASVVAAVNVWFLNPLRAIMCLVHDFFECMDEYVHVLLAQFGGWQQFKNDKATTFRLYDARVDRMKKKFAGTNRLLVYNIKDGWQPLCEFFDVPFDKFKDVPFPRANEGTRFARDIPRAMIEETFKFFTTKYGAFIMLCFSTAIAAAIGTWKSL